MDLFVKLTDLTDQTNQTSQRVSIWNEIIGDERLSEWGGLDRLFECLDRLARRTEDEHVRGARRTSRRRHGTTAEHVRPPRRRSLSELCRNECQLLRLHVRHYLRLTVGNFDDRGRALKEATQAVHTLEDLVEHRAGLQPPERIVLLSLLKRWEKLFTDTIAIYVDTARRAVHARRPELFWRKLTHDPHMPPTTQIEVAEELLKGHFRTANAELMSQEAVAPSERAPFSDEPPRPDMQDVAFERFYAEWMSSELDIHHLRWALERRWGWFKRVYALMTNLTYTAALIAAPMLLAAFLHWLQAEEVEGIGFFFYLLVLAAVSGRLMYERYRAERHADPKRPEYPYRFQAMLPRLARLIVVPLALLVDFEHSYLFPMHASQLVLIILLLIAFAAPRSFIRREVLNSENELSPVEEHETSTNVNRRVRQILSIALTHSFVVTLIFSFLFESNYVARIRIADIVHKHTAVTGKLSGMDEERGVESTSRFHHEPIFLWAIPREARCDLGWLFTRMTGVNVPGPCDEWLRFDFYPTLILSWTALGLFFGVFLDGFLKGEHLRGEMHV
jgi:hypothetical protein